MKEYNYSIEYVCDECGESAAVVVSNPHSIAESDFRLYAPFCCAKCGTDNFEIVNRCDISAFADAKNDELATLQAASDEQSKAIAESKHIMRGILELLQSGAFTAEYKLLSIRKELEDYLAPSVATATAEER